MGELCLYRVAQVLQGGTGSKLGLRLGLVYGRMSTADMACNYVCVSTRVRHSQSTPPDATRLDASTVEMSGVVGVVGRCELATSRRTVRAYI